MSEAREKGQAWRTLNPLGTAGAFCLGLPHMKLRIVLTLLALLSTLAVRSQETNEIFVLHGATQTVDLKAVLRK